GKSWLTKFSSPSPYLDWAPVIRYSEVLLSLAEARAKKTSSVDAQAVALLNAVRNRSDPATTFTVGDFASSTDLVNAILEERNIEFLGEGRRSPDIMRLGLPFPAKGTVGAIQPSAPSYIFPAPSSETQYNTLW
ncbi:MAG: RagB/SusD family nutrient uptake outer membrane protein, partial [Bacteroidota bacterium]